MSAKLEAIEARIAAKLEQVRQLKEQKARAERRARAEIKNGNTPKIRAVKFCSVRCGWKN